MMALATREIQDLYAGLVPYGEFHLCEDPARVPAAKFYVEYVAKAPDGTLRWRVRFHADQEDDVRAQLIAAALPIDETTKPEAYV